MISKGEKEKQRKDLNKFIEQNVQGINKIGVAASGRHVHKKGGGGLKAAAPLFAKAYFVYSLDILFNEFIQVLSLLFLFPFAYLPRESNRI